VAIASAAIALSADLGSITLPPPVLVPVENLPVEDCWRLN
jgi:hypothetical protein